VTVARGWKRLRLGDLVRLRKGVSYQGAFLDQPGPRLLGLGTVVPGGGLKLNDARTYGGPIKEWQYLRPGELFVALTDITQDGRILGSPALLSPFTDGSFAVTHHVARVEILEPEAVDARFFYYLLQAPSTRDYMRGVVTGTTVRAVSVADAEAHVATFPPISEQRAIAGLLGALDDKIELNRRMSETLESMARALFKSWFVDFDPVRAKAEGRDPGLPQPIACLFPDRFEDPVSGEIPAGWEVHQLSDVMEINPPRSLSGGTTAPYLEMANMPTQGHSPAAVVYRAFTSGVRFVNGDTLVARITPCLENGKTAYVDFLEDGQTGWGSTEYIILRPKAPLASEFGYLLARLDEFRDYAIQRMTGSSGRQRVSADAVSRFALAVPPSVVAERFGEIVRPLFGRARAATEESETLRQIRDALLPKLISGEIRVPEADRILEAVGA